MAVIIPYLLFVTLIVTPNVAWSETVLPDLRFFSSRGTVGRIVADGAILWHHLGSLLAEADAYYLDIGIPGNPELDLAFVNVQDHSFSKPIRNSNGDQIAGSYRYLALNMPIVSGSARHGYISLVKITDSKERILNPYNTNNKNIVYIDSIEEADDGTVTFREGDDVMVLQVGDAREGCRDEDAGPLGRDFDEITGAYPTSSNFPLEFDWECDSLSGNDVRFCEILNMHQEELAHYGANVCTRMRPLESTRCRSSLRIIEMTGYFAYLLRFLPSSLPITSFEAEWVDRLYTGDVIFPCF